MFTATTDHHKIAEELLAETRSPQDAYEYAIRREKGIEHSRTMKTNPFEGQATTTTTKQESKHYIIFFFVEVTTQIIRTHKKVEVYYAVDHVAWDTEH